MTWLTEVICLCQGSVFAAYVLNFTWAVWCSVHEVARWPPDTCTLQLSWIQKFMDAGIQQLRHGALKLYSVVRSLEVYNGLWNSCLETSWARSIFRNKRDAWQMLIKHVENVYRPFLFKPVLQDAPRMADSWHAIFLPAQEDINGARQITNKFTTSLGPLFSAAACQQSL